MALITRLFIAGSVASIFSGCGASPSAAEGGEAEPAAVLEGALSSSGLTRTESAIALDLIDDICGDSWCERENDFEFRALACSARANRCTLVFKIIPRDSVPGARPFYWRSCTTGNLPGSSRW